MNIPFVKKLSGRSIVFATLTFFLAAFAFAAEKPASYTASQLREKALSQESVQEGIAFIQKHVEQCATSADKRSSLYFLGTLQEQLGIYSEAGRSYAKAASIAASDATGMEKVSSEQLVLDAVRCCLNSGDWETADSYLNSAVRSSKDKKVLAFVNLYSVWSALCKAQNYSEASDSIDILTAYASMSSMEYVRPAVLFTLWFLTDKKEYSEALRKKYPLSAEYAVIKGDVQIANVPFWYFVPRSVYPKSGFAETEYTDSAATNSAATNSSAAESKLSTESKPSQDKKSSAEKTASQEKTSAKAPSSSGKANPPAGAEVLGSKVRYQAGFFGVKANAQDLIDRLKKKGFDAYCYTETRASGKTYYVVVVDENKAGNISQKMKAAGFDNYPVK
ncbi:MAG: SPOR domain-containing protein [Treponema sp.]|nr:SPOR domain-containing protein [Treponema sp.]